MATPPLTIGGSAGTVINGFLGKVETMFGLPGSTPATSGSK
jgi:hypothetical protein